MSSFGVTPAAPERQSTRISGVVVALVVDNKDPQGFGRVQVRFPWLSDDQVAHWARIAVLMAGNARGTFFLPEVDDEVLVAFENGDIARPYVLGALWNGQDLPPDTNADGKNNLRFIKSRSGHLVRLDDTDGAEKIEIIDKSGNNSIVIDTANKKITITSDQDVAIEAPNGKITLNAANVEIKSSADTKITAQGGTKIESSGNTDIKGAAVNLN